MAWRGRNTSHCKVCEQPRAVVGSLSARGKCWNCGARHCIDNATQLHEHDGPYFENWRRRMVACVGGVLLDEALEEA